MARKKRAAEVALDAARRDAKRDLGDLIQNGLPDAVDAEELRLIIHELTLSLYVGETTIEGVEAKVYDLSQSAERLRRWRVYLMVSKMRYGGLQKEIVNKFGKDALFLLLDIAKQWRDNRRKGSEQDAPEELAVPLLG